jgi:hypothetical protein
MEEERRRKISFYEMSLLPHAPFGLQFLACIRRLTPLSSTMSPRLGPTRWQDTGNEENGYVQIQQMVPNAFKHGCIVMKCHSLQRDARDFLTRCRLSSYLVLNTRILSSLRIKSSSNGTCWECDQLMSQWWFIPVSN